MATNPALHSIFVSYDKADHPWAEWIAWILEEAGHKVVIEAWDFGPGSNSTLEREKALESSDKILIVLTDSYLKSASTQPEWAAAFSQDPKGLRRKLVPVRVAECFSNALLQPISPIDLVGLAATDAVEALLRGFKKRLKPDLPPAFPGTARVLQHGPVPFPGGESFFHSPQEEVHAQEYIGSAAQFLTGLLPEVGLDQSSTGLAVADLADRIIRLVEPNLSKLKNFVSTLAVSWSTRGRRRGSAVSFSPFLLLAFLHNYHPEVHRLLSSDPSLVRDLHSVLTEGAAKTPPFTSPVYLFFRRAFRHAFQGAFPEGFGFEYGHKDEAEIVTELIARLDHLKGDRAFIELWRQTFGDTTMEGVVESVTLVLWLDQAQQD